jgi:hypothetical protein
MDRSISKLPDPSAQSAQGERRRSVRQKPHTPVYASFNGSQAGIVVDLSELLDLHEDGFAIQTGERLEANRAVTLCLDMPETKSYVHGTGQVIWSDDSGRGGIRFSALSDSSRKILKEWLFANLLIACSNHAARTEQRARRDEENQRSVMTKPLALHESSPVASIADLNGSDVNRSMASSEFELDLEIVRGRVRELGEDIDSILQLITERALNFTESNGAAMAFLTDGKMICRARSGEPAPPLGAALDTQQGLSGECVRTGRLVSCEDTEHDQRVDADVCRSLGIGSLMAAPIVSGFRVVGVLEVLSPHPRNLKESYGVVLGRIVEMIPKLRSHNGQPETAQPQTTERVAERVADKAEVLPVLTPSSSSQSDSIPSGSSKSDSISAIRDAFRDENHEQKHSLERQLPQQVEEPAAASPEHPARLVYRALLGLSLAVAVAALTYVFAPAVKNWAESQQVARWLAVRPARAINVAEAASARPADVRSADLRSDDLRSAASRSVDSGSVDPNPVDPDLVDRSLADHNSQPKSLQALRKLAEAGDTDAQWQMGVRYHDGQGVPQDDAQAVRWFQLAAERGNVAAQGALGAYYWRGRGVPADLLKAYFWSALAMAQGDEMSKSRIEGLSSQMTGAQISVARQQAEDWISSHSRP